MFNTLYVFAITTQAYLWKLLDYIFVDERFRFSSKSSSSILTNEIHFFNDVHLKEKDYDYINIILFSLLTIISSILLVYIFAWRYDRLSYLSITTCLCMDILSKWIDPILIHRTTRRENRYHITNFRDSDYTLRANIFIHTYEVSKYFISGCGDSVIANDF